GSRTNLADVVNELSVKVAAALNLSLRATAWSPAEESEQYFAEAKWAARWGMMPEAAAAAESSWALGKKQPEVAELRLSAYRSMLEAGSEEIPNPEKLSLLNHLLALYERDFGIFIAHDSKPPRVWYDLGLDLLDSTSGRLN